MGKYGQSCDPIFLQSNAVTQTILGGQQAVCIVLLQISCSVHVPKIMKIGFK